MNLSSRVLNDEGRLVDGHYRIIGGRRVWDAPPSSQWLRDFEADGCPGTEPGDPLKMRKRGAGGKFLD